MSLGLLLGGASLAGGLMSAEAAKAAAAEQAAASRYATDVQKQMFDIQNAQQAPYRGTGYTALSEIARRTGTGTNVVYDPLTGQPTTVTGNDYFTSPYTAAEFQKGMDPGYQFRLQQGLDLAKRQGNVGGGLVGGNVMKGLEDYTQQSASQEFQNAFNRNQTEKTNIYNRLASMAGLGQASLQQTGNAGAATASNIGNLAVGAANAGAAGTVGAANALGGGIQGAAQGYTLGQILQRAPESLYTPSSSYSSGANYDLAAGQSTGGLGLRY